MNRIYTWVVVGLFLMLVPLGSWYYLHQGLQYRKQLLKELEVKYQIDSSADSLKLLFGNANLVVLDNSNKILEIVNQLNDQFANSPKFNIIFKDSVDQYSYLPQGYMAEEWNKMSGSSFVLLDTLMNVKNTYLDDLDQIKKLVEHISVVIPRQKEADIKVKQNN